MGCATRVYLPMDIRVDDVKTVLALAMGAKVVKDGPFDRTAPTGALKFGNYELRSCSAVPNMNYMGPYTYHYCARHKGKLYNMLNGGCNAVTIALFKRVAMMLGGRVKINDCDEKKDIVYPRLKVTKDENGMTPEENPEYERYTKYLFSTSPITAKELREADKIAAYKLVDMHGEYKWVDELLKELA